MLLFCCCFLLLFVVFAQVECWINYNVRKNKRFSLSKVDDSVKYVQSALIYQPNFKQIKESFIVLILLESVFPWLFFQKKSLWSLMKVKYSKKLWNMPPIVSVFNEHPLTVFVTLINKTYLKTPTLLLIKDSYGKKWCSYSKQIWFLLLYKFKRITNNLFYQSHHCKTLSMRMINSMTFSFLTQWL